MNEKLENATQQQILVKSCFPVSSNCNVTIIVNEFVFQCILLSLYFCDVWITVFLIKLWLKLLGWKMLLELHSIIKIKWWFFLQNGVPLKQLLFWYLHILFTLPCFIWIYLIFRCLRMVWSILSFWRFSENATWTPYYCLGQKGHSRMHFCSIWKYFTMLRTIYFHIIKVVC